ncbi:MAG: B12-binding domain-containing radical SAM protein, partial [Pseudomonadota bacterium]
MTYSLLVQLPIPKLNAGVRTGNIPLASAWLKLASSDMPGESVDILPESIASYLGDAALIRLIAKKRPDIAGFTIYCWNVDRSIYIAQILKEIYSVKIVFGGPEVTPDNEKIQTNIVDFLVYGDGEKVFQKLISDKDIWEQKNASQSASRFFRSSKSPYISGLLEPEIENMALLETQRGCPYKCGYCYYSKSRKGLAVADEDILIAAIAWATDNKIAELFLLDPSLNTRPGLKDFLKKIGKINKDKTLSIMSEIRAEFVDHELSGLFAQAGFSQFEIGLQSINTKALKLMNRPTDLERFVTGATLLKKQGIIPVIDLIIGLPGDDLEGFKKSVNFVADHDLADDIQVFPLLVLPGTNYRINSQKLGITFDSSPPYTVIETPAFPRDDILMGLDYAETVFDTVLYPQPDLEISFRSHDSGQAEPCDHTIKLGNEMYISKLMINRFRPIPDLEDAAV